MAFVKESPITYFMINESPLSQEINSEYFKIVNEDVVSGVGGNKIHVMHYNCILTELDRKNWNGRTYNESFCTALDNNALFQNDLKNNGGVGSEISHPIINGSDPSSLARQMTILTERVCSMLKKYWRDPKNRKILIGEFMTVPGQYGDMIRDRMIVGIPAMVSSRSVGGVDAKGNVLPTVVTVTWDHCMRMSSQDARSIPGTARIQEFSTADFGNGINECAVQIDYNNGLKDFLLSESVSRDKIYRVCEAMDLDFDSMFISENALHIERINETTKTEIVMPLNKLVGHEMYNLW